MAPRVGNGVEDRPLRAPPAFQVYASDDLASSRYFLLPLAQRGLLDAMRRACWVDIEGSVPRDPAQLALVVRCSEADVREALTPQVLAWFAVGPDPTRLVDPDLQRQMAELMDRRQRQRAGAVATNEKLKRGKGDTPTESDSDTGSAALSAPDSDTLLRREEERRNQSVGTAQVSSTTQEDEWTTEYARAEQSLNKTLPIPINVGRRA